jgi:hypothetical protein
MTGEERIISWMHDNTYCGHYDEREPLLVTRLRSVLSSPEQVADVLEIISSTCQHCYDSESGCQCWNDD